MSCTTAANTKTHQDERACSKTRGQEGQKGEVSLQQVFRHKLKNWLRQLLQLDVKVDHFSSEVTASLCKCYTCEGESSPSLRQPCHFALVLLSLPLSNTDAVSDSCCLLLCWPHSAAAPWLSPPEATAEAKAYQRDASVFSPYLLGRALCDGGLRLAGSCMFSLGKQWEWRAAGGSTSAAGSVDESHSRGSRNSQDCYHLIS